MFKGVRHNRCGDQPASGTLIRTGIFGVLKITAKAAEGSAGQQEGFKIGIQSLGRNAVCKTYSSQSHNQRCDYGKL